MSSIEFITVHYTGNMAKGSTASANANYFATNTSTSIHYVTGNDGVFSVLDDSYVAYHAGDGTSVKFEWFPTGVTYKDGDPVHLYLVLLLILNSLSMVLRQQLVFQKELLQQTKR